MRGKQKKKQTGTSYDRLTRLKKKPVLSNSRVIHDTHTNRQPDIHIKPGAVLDCLAPWGNIPSVSQHFSPILCLKKKKESHLTSKVTKPMHKAGRFQYCRASSIENLNLSLLVGIYVVTYLPWIETLFKQKVNVCYSLNASVPFLVYPWQTRLPCTLFLLAQPVCQTGSKQTHLTNGR